MGEPKDPSNRMHIHVVADDVFFPRNSGGRVEALELSRALKSAGHRVSVTLMQREDIPSDQLRKHFDFFDDVQILRRESILSATRRRPLLPYQLASREFPGADIRVPGKPDIVLVQHEWALPCARRVAAAHHSTIILRSHNDELAYLRSLRDAASLGPKKLYYALEYFRAARSFVPSFYSGVATTLTISAADGAFYDERGVRNAFLAPSLGVDAVEEGSAPLPPQEPVLVFAGSLDMSYVVEGLNWFIADVLPRIRTAVPDARLSVMGRRATAELAAALEAAEHVDFLGEVDDVAPHLAAGRLFLNPVFSGSGINMKMGPPAQLGVPIVSTTVGARGLDALASSLAIADDAEGFARECVRLIHDDQLWRTRSAGLRHAISAYGPRRIAEAFERFVDDVNRTRA